ncbi:uncharacterized protein [Eurosta solidaginis]|uniref:uncharacterized protein isoform X2 n=1 Tax=Eurosta solidaginis TaxID=178769 RepID=UPI003531622A
MPRAIIPVLLVFVLYACGSLAIRCYQCSSDQDRKGYDSCGAYKPFNRTEHIPIECNTDESHMPGSFCMKVVQQGPRGFIYGLTNPNGRNKTTERIFQKECKGGFKTARTTVVKRQDDTDYAKPIRQDQALRSSSSLAKQ